MTKCVAVSVLITYYNQKKYIKDSLLSVISQKTSFDYEIICGDDGSSDGTYEELVLWQKKYPSLITICRMPRNLDEKCEPIIRASNNRHTMLKQSRGKYISILDGDDYFCDEYKLQKQFDMLEKHPECSSCCHSMKYVWDTNDRKEEPLGHLSDKACLLRNFDYWSFYWLPAEAFLFRNYYLGKVDAINKNFFDDNTITAYFIKMGSIIYLPDCMVVYRQVASSSWNSRDYIRKLYINVICYQETKKILCSIKMACFFRYSTIISALFKNRNKNFEIESNGLLSATERMYIETTQYKTNTFVNKMIYIVKYFVPAHLEVFIKIIKKINKLRWKKLRY